MTRQFSLLDSLLEPPKPLSVSQLTERIKRLLEGRFVDLWVEGEISNLKLASSGHWYFTLKDSGAAVRAACFRSTNQRIRFRPKDGLAVRVRGRIALFEPRGEYQLIVDTIEPVGVGALQLAFEQLKARLAAERLFDASRKRPIPALPRRVGVVTSPAGAALRDILRVLGRRNRAVSVLIAPARVQGDGSAAEIARAITRLSESGLVDVIIAGRGGGSLEDLWAFNEEVVARAIANARVPVISAVGHETDFTIADFVADRRAPTPSAAAEIVAAAADDTRGAIHALRRTAASSMKYRLLAARSAVRERRHAPPLRFVPNRVARAAQATDEARDALVDIATGRLGAARAGVRAMANVLVASDPRRRVLVHRAGVRTAASKLEALARASVDERRQELARIAGTLSSLSPLDVLLRGYALVRDASGRIVRSAADVAPGDRVRVRVANGEFGAVRDDDVG